MPDAAAADWADAVDAVRMLGSAAAAIAAPPPGQHAAVLRVCVGELNCREAAEAPGIPIGAVRRRLIRARIVVADRLGTSWPLAPSPGDRRPAQGRTRWQLPDGTLTASVVAMATAGDGYASVPSVAALDTCLAATAAEAPLSPEDEAAALAAPR